MRTFGKVFGLLAVAAGGYFLVTHYEIQGLDRLNLKPRAASPGSTATTVGGPPRVEGSAETITIASFNIQAFGQAKLGKPEVMQVLAQVVRKFDVVAVQEIRSKNQDLIPKFLALINAEGAHYDYAISPPLGRTVSKEQYVFLFDTARIELDRESLYVVDDPDDLLHREPLVAGFRVRGPAPQEAFTFTLVNIHTDPDEVAAELDALDDVYRAVQRDGRGEDDVILLGDLNADDRHLGQVGALSSIIWAISGVATNTRGTKLYDNLIFQQTATTEYTGRSGVLNLMQEFGLSQEQALEVSDHQPIWAEFSVREGGAGGRVAGRPAGPPR